jgi:hypothetical protein
MAMPPNEFALPLEDISNDMLFGLLIAVGFELDQSIKYVLSAWQIGEISGNVPRDAVVPQRTKLGRATSNVVSEIRLIDRRWAGSPPIKHSWETDADGRRIFVATIPSANEGERTRIRAVVDEVRRRGFIVEMRVSQKQPIGE